MPKPTAALPLLLLVLLSACGPSSSRDGVAFLDGASDSGAQVSLADQFQRLQKADPLADASAAFQRGDYRFAGVIGSDFIAPGIQREADVAYQLKLIDWKPEPDQTALEAHVDRLAFEYASRYNRRLLYLFNQSSQH